MESSHLSHQTSVCDLPLELLLRISSYVSFSDLWYFGTCSRACQKVAQQLVHHKYHIDLLRQQRINSFNHIIHSAVAFLCRHGYEDKSQRVNHIAIQSVANRLAVEIYDRTPQSNWAPCFDFFLDKMLGILLDHVLYDSSLDEPLPSMDDLPSLCKTKNYTSTKMSHLMSNLLVTLYPTLTALFDTDPASTIHHRLLLTHISRHIDSLTRRYHQQHRRWMQQQLSKPNAITETRNSPPNTSTVKQGFRVLVQFIGTLAQTELMTAADLSILTQQRIVYFFQSQPATPSPNSDEEDVEGDAQVAHSDGSSSTTITTSKGYFDERQYLIEETEFQIIVLFDLLRAAVCRQYTRWDSGKELHLLASLFNETVGSIPSCKPASLPSDLFVSTSASTASPPSSSSSSSSSSGAAPTTVSPPR
ncbi:hypothetical protein BX666DRAFT_649473 [Dichotomocladium elegans]|nr:hypothetical protein BX666DRAFT_649473 [Dichotomocladium elegans]